MNNLIPAFDYQRVILDPWTTDFPFTIWIIVMGALIGTACGIVGNYLLLRRMALIGDAISHSILPGLVVVFILFKTKGTLVMFLGALIAGLITVILISFIEKRSRVKSDAATCVVFTTMFAFGVVLTTLFAHGGNIDLDTECILYGEIAFIAVEPMVEYAGYTLAPAPILRMAGVAIAALILVIAFYKELLITSFDSGLSKSMGVRTSVWHYGLMVALSLVVVSAFEAVGAIMVVAMLIVPPMFAAQLSTRLPTRIMLTIFHAVVASIGGYHLSVWLNCSVAGAMVVFGSLMFIAVWMNSLLVSKIRKVA